MNRFTAVVLLTATLLTAERARGATSVFIPVSPQSTTSKLEELNWLRNNLGDDGYLRIQAKLDLDAPCMPVGKGGWAATIGQEKVQLAVSVMLTGVASPLAGKEIPIAAVDGRESPGDCIEVATPTVTLVPTLRIGRGMNEPVAIQVKARTTSKADLNLVSTARAAITVASLFATPAVTAALGSASAIIAAPALQNAEAYLEARMAGRTPAQASRIFKASEIRDGVLEVSFPVHIGEYGWGTGKPSDEAKAIPLIAISKQNSNESPVFKVNFSFMYTRSIFTLAYKADGQPVAEEIQDNEILAYPGVEGVPSVYQWLSGSSPTEPQFLQLFSKANAPSEFKEYCGQLLKILDKRGLNLLDRSLVLRSFINTARGNQTWYRTKSAQACTQDHPKIMEAWLAVFGPLPPPLNPLGLDTMQRPPTGQDGQYDTWLLRSVPSLISLRTALKASENQEAYLLRATKGSKLEILATKSEDGWPDIKPELGDKAWIARLTSKKLKAVGCFSYQFGSSKLDINFSPSNFLLLDEKGVIWIAQASFSGIEGGGISELEIYQLNSAWKVWYEDLFQREMLGTSGDCAVIKQSIPSSPLFN